VFLSIFLQSEFKEDIYSFMFGDVFTQALQRLNKRPSELLSNYKLRTPLHLIAALSHSSLPEVFTWLLQPAIFQRLELDVNARDIDGRTPLFFARKKAIALQLLQSGARLDVVDIYGRSPGEHFTYSVGQQEALATLLLEFFEKKDFDRLRRLINVECLVRISGGSSVSFSSPPIEKQAMKMVIEFIHSDEHFATTKYSLVYNALQVSLRNSRSFLLGTIHFSFAIDGMIKGSFWTVQCCYTILLTTTSPSTR